MRKAYVATDRANLDWSPICERPIDRVAAAAAAGEKLDIWKSKYGQDRSAYERLRGLVARVVASKWPREKHTEKIVDQALAEYLSPECQVCHGNEVVDYLRGRVCSGCKGTKLQVYTDEKRGRMMKVGMGTTRMVSHKVSYVVGWLTHNDSRVNAIINQSLERAG